MLKALESVLLKAGYSVNTVSDRKTGLQLFLQYKPGMVLLDEEFLPRFHHRLLQFYKVAHRSPGIVIFKRSQKDLSGYRFLTDEIIEEIRVPFKIEELLVILKQITNYMQIKARALFYKDLLVHVGLAVPVIIFLVVLLIKN